MELHTGFQIHRRRAFAVIAFEFFISFAIDSLTFSSGSTRWNSVSVPTSPRFSYNENAHVGYTCVVTLLCARAVNSRVSSRYHLVRSLMRTEISPRYQFPLLFLCWYSSINLQRQLVTIFYRPLRLFVFGAYALH